MNNVGMNITNNINFEGAKVKNSQIVKKCKRGMKNISMDKVPTQNNITKEGVAGIVDSLSSGEISSKDALKMMNEMTQKQSVNTVVESFRTGNMKYNDAIDKLRNIAAESGYKI